MEEQVIKIQSAVRGNLERRRQYALHPQLLKRNLRKILKQDYEIWTRLDMNFIDDDFYDTINKRATLKENNSSQNYIPTEPRQEKQAVIYTSGSERSQDSLSSRDEKRNEEDKDLQETMCRNVKCEEAEKIEEIEKIGKAEKIGKVEKIGDIEYENEREDRDEKEECNRPGIEIQEDEANSKVEENTNKLERILDTSCYSNTFSPEDIRDISQTQYHLDSVSSVSLEELGQNDPFELNHSYIVKDSELQHNIDSQGRAASFSPIQEAKVNPSLAVQDIVPIPTDRITGLQLENAEGMNSIWNERSICEDKDLLEEKSSDSNEQFIIVVHNVSDQNIHDPYIEYLHDEHNESCEDQNVSNVSRNKKIVFSFNVSRLDSGDSEECEEGNTDSYIDSLMKKAQEDTDNCEEATIDKREEKIAVKSDREEQDQFQVDRDQPSSFMNRLFGNKNSSSDVMTDMKSESENYIPAQPSPINNPSLLEAKDPTTFIDKKPEIEIQPEYSEPGKHLDQESDHKVYKLEGSIIPLSIQESDKPDLNQSFIPITKEEDIIIAPSSLEPDSLEAQESQCISNKENIIAQLAELYEAGKPEAQVSSLNKIQEGENVLSLIIDDFCIRNDIDPDLTIDNKADEVPSGVSNGETGTEISHKCIETDDIKAKISKFATNNSDELVILPRANEANLTQNEEVVYIVNEKADSFPEDYKEENIGKTDSLSQACKHKAQDLSDMVDKQADSSIPLSDKSEGQDSSINSSKHSISDSSRSSSHFKIDRSASYSSKSYKFKSPKSSSDSKRSSYSSNPSLTFKSHLVQSPTEQIPSQSLPNRPSNQSELSLMTHFITFTQESDHDISHQAQPQNASNSLSFSRSHRSDSHYRFDSFTPTQGKHSSKPSDKFMPNINKSRENPHHELESDFHMYSDAGIFIEDFKAFKIETSSMNNSRSSFSTPHILIGTTENSQYVSTESLKSQSKLELKCESGLARYGELTPEQLAEEGNFMLEEAVDQHGLSAHNLIRDIPFKSCLKIKLPEIKSDESISSHSPISATTSVINHRVLQVTRHKAFSTTKNRPDLLKKDTRIDDNTPSLMITKDISSNPQIPYRSSKSKFYTPKLDMPVINEQLANRFYSKSKLNEESIEAFNSPNLNTLKKQGSNMLSLPKLKKDFSSAPHSSVYTSGRLDQLLSPNSKLFMPPARLISTGYQKELPKPKIIGSPYSGGWTDKILKTFYDVKVEILQGKGSFKPKYILKKASAVNLPNLKLKKEPSYTLEPNKKQKKSL